MALGKLGTWGSKWDLGHHPRGQSSLLGSSPNLLGLLKCLEGTRAPKSRYFLEFAAFWFLQGYINGDVEMILCPLAVTFVQGSRSHFQWRDTPRRQRWVPRRALTTSSRFGKGKMPLACVLAISECRNSFLFLSFPFFFSFLFLYMHSSK